MIRGKYIVIEGPEGVGKTTQLHELAHKFRAAGLAHRILREPDSQTDITARAIRQLTQDPSYPMNSRTEVLLYNAARAQSLESIRNSITNGVSCLVDRNYLTTLAIQYYGRGDIPEYSTINSIIDFAVGDMQPDLTIVLDAPVSVLRERMAERKGQDRFDNLSEAFLERVRAGYLWEAKQRGFPVVFADDTKDNVGSKIWDYTKDVLAVRVNIDRGSVKEPASIKQIFEQKSEVQSISKNITENSIVDEDFVIKNEDGSFKITDNGKRFLEQSVTNPTDNVYAFNESLSPVTIAAAMARLSRRGDDMRITILDEFAGKIDKDSDLLKRIITAYGDDSVQQLGGIHVVVENASNLLTKKLEWGRLASYLEQSTRYIYFDKKDDRGNYKYYYPKYLPRSILRSYRTKLDKVFLNYSIIVRKLTEYIRKNSSINEDERDGAWMAATRAQACDAARSLLPVATKSTVGIYASGQAIESLIMHLLSDSLKESNLTGKKMLAETRKVIPMFLERADKPERGGAAIAYRSNTKRELKKLTNEYLTSGFSTDNNPVNLVDYWPKNEMLLVSDMLYENSDLSLEEIQTQISSWSYDKKASVMNAYIGERLNRRHKPGRALEKAHYSWDILCDYGIFRDLQRHRIVDDLTWQDLSPRYGYDTPSLIDEADLNDLFDECFEISLSLYDELKKAGLDEEAQYATLLGHKMRWKITYNAREAFHIHELRSSPQGHPGYRNLIMKMHEKLSEVHPLIAGAMNFVNTEEDPELTRLAAERYTQFKLQQLKTK